jgi:hypothetical protein
MITDLVAEQTVGREQDSKPQSKCFVANLTVYYLLLSTLNQKPVHTTA